MLSYSLRAGDTVGGRISLLSFGLHLREREWRHGFYLLKTISANDKCQIMENIKVE